VTAVARIARRGDLVLTLGAGSIGSLPDRIVDALAGATAANGGASAATSGERE
jgi:hypothetical protein